MSAPTVGRYFQPASTPREKALRLAFAELIEALGRRIEEGGDCSCEQETRCRFCRDSEALDFAGEVWDECFEPAQPAAGVSP